MSTVQESTLINKVSLPKDTGPHLLSNIEWWYCYAYLDGANGGKYAAVISFFEVGDIPFLKGHYLIFSLIDLKENKRKNFSLMDKNLVLNMDLMLGPYYLFHCPKNKKIRKLLKFKVSPPHKLIKTASIKRNPVRILYGDNFLEFIDEKSGEFKVHVIEGDVEIDFTFSPTKPVSLVGGDGKPGELYYYSFTNNEVSGYVKSNNLTENVTGKGWFDHQWGISHKLIIEEGWNWFGLQLDDGRELLIEESRLVNNGKTFSPMANLIEKDGSLKFTNSVLFEPNDSWKSPKTGAVYPLSWDISIPEFSITLNVTADFQEQEMPVTLPLRAIWEGTCSFSGTEILPDKSIKSISGKGFIELVGYANYKCK